MTGTELAIIFATLAGPILAVQAQKRLEIAREKRNRKLQIFNVLMATRAARMSPDHVQALNMIELAFYGRKVFWFRWQTQSERAVVTTWHTYFDALGIENGPPRDPGRREENFVSLLVAIANDVDYDFDRIQITKSAYSPVGHWHEQQEQEALRRCLLDVFSGSRAIKMDVGDFPFDAALSESTIELQKKIVAAFREGALSVRQEPTRSL